jgi:hypothetical protein
MTVPSGPTAMLEYMPTSGPSSAMPWRIFESGITTGPSGTPSTHSHASSAMRPSMVACATTRSPCDCAYADTHTVPFAPAATSEYAPSRPIGMSSSQMHMLSMQNGSWPESHALGSQSFTVSQ